ncbi:hypothetical protein VB713_26515 [Anabaena cylindrica UHCC 0172]|nr:hypothetical protein [Anabaena cylindrica UHCC 0172]
MHWSIAYATLCERSRSTNQPTNQGFFQFEQGIEITTAKVPT